MRLATLFFLFVLFVNISLAGVEIAADNLDEIKKHEGAFVVIKGTVVNSYMPKSGKVVFLNFSQDYRNSFTAVIFASDFKNFKSVNVNPATYYNGKTVKVEGIIKMYRGKPEIIVTTPKQIKILD